MEKTNQDIWDEVLRTAQTLRLQEEQTMASGDRATAGLTSPDEIAWPVDYVADAQILTRLVLSLKARGARVS